MESFALYNDSFQVLYRIRKNYMMLTRDDQNSDSYISMLRVKGYG